MNASSLGRPLTEVNEIVDPDDPDLIIGYERFGEAFSCQLLFSAAIDGLASSAQEEAVETIEMITGTEYSEKVVYSVFGKRNHYGLLLMTEDMFRRIMRLLPLRLLEEGNCGEVRFNVTYGGIKMAGGRFWVPDFLNVS